MDSTQPVSPAPVMPPAGGDAPMAQKSSLGAVLGIAIIVAAIVAGAWYMFSQRTMNDMQSASDMNALETQGTSTDPTAIQADLSAESPDDFDKGVENAFGELDASLDSK